MFSLFISIYGIIAKYKITIKKNINNPYIRLRGLYGLKNKPLVKNPTPARIVTTKLMFISIFLLTKFKIALIIAIETGIAAKIIAVI